MTSMPAPANKANQGAPMGMMATRATNVSEENEAYSDPDRER